MYLALYSEMDLCKHIGFGGIKAFYFLLGSLGLIRKGLYIHAWRQGELHPKRAFMHSIYNLERRSAVSMS